jgi:2-dehydropantoate 2-reductase
MNIVVFGAGAIGSLFGGLLSKTNNVILIGRKNHVQAINSINLKIIGKTKKEIKLQAFENVTKVTDVDLIILTVKSFDTDIAVKQLKPLINSKTIIMSLQNGLHNIDKIQKYVNKNQIVAGITTHGAIFEKPGLIIHSGIGKTTIGELNGKKTPRIIQIAETFNKAEIKTTINSDIKDEIWIKAIINSSINTLTTFFNCKNGYLLENPILENLVEKICIESTNVAKSEGYKFDNYTMIKKTKEVINDTIDNYSSMLQSIKQKKKTEIDSINGKIVECGRKNNVDLTLNEILIHYIKSNS